MEGMGNPNQEKKPKRTANAQGFTRAMLLATLAAIHAPDKIRTEAHLDAGFTNAIRKLEKTPSDQVAKLHDSTGRAYQPNTNRLPPRPDSLDQERLDNKIEEILEEPIQEDRDNQKEKEDKSHER